MSKPNVHQYRSVQGSRLAWHNKQVYILKTLASICTVVGHSGRNMHSDHLIGTKWEKTGHPCLIPGSMLDGAAILYPLKGAFNTGCSVSHGSGRVMARGQAKRELAEMHDEIDKEMRYIKRMLGGVEIQGIVGNTRRTPLDECGHVYKDLDEVLRVLETEGIAQVVNRMYPVANIKGAD